MDDAGSALVSKIARHWNVVDDSARDIIAAAKLVSAKDSGWKRYLWRDIWRIEGEILVPQRHWQLFRAPLLKTCDLPSLDPEERSARTLRRYVEQGKISGIRLTPNIVCIRRCGFDIAIHHV